MVINYFIYILLYTNFIQNVICYNKRILTNDPDHVETRFNQLEQKIQSLASQLAQNENQMIQMENTIHGLATRLTEKDKESIFETGFSSTKYNTHIHGKKNAQKDKLILQISSNITALQVEERRIAFHARMSTDKTHLASYATVKFETIVTNEGQAYSPVTGVFTCPQDGTYSFSWTLITLAGNECNTEFVVNGTGIVYVHDEANSSNNHKSSSQSAVVQLKKGNKTWIRAHRSDGGRCYPTWSSYSGFKV
ncbi:unnamed protein product [Mytilus coruscus]|uniref:C1q domain-containing protein n=1 Tax=Mytilus coruscus TaxID=42192 RepID=A0A6J8EUA9_MYTCO|nr:unnamed protein product [Mytilus coruscus]